MILAHKIRLYPNNKQATYFSKACGVARFAYNWALEEWTKQYKSGLKPKENELRKQLNAIKRERYPWMLEVTKCAPQLAIKDLGKAFNNFFHKRAVYPTYHKKGVNDSFSISNDQFTVTEKFIKIPNLGNVRMAEKLRFTGKIIGAAISRTSDNWFVAIQIELADDIKKADFLCENQAIGIEDLNVKGMMSNHKLAKAISDMSFFEFRRQLEYKAKLSGSKVVVADRFFPSSKLCSCCGYKLEELKLSEREWECPNCHTKHDRDVNAAINLKNYALAKLA